MRRVHFLKSEKCRERFCKSEDLLFEMCLSALWFLYMKSLLLQEESRLQKPRFKTVCRFGGTAIHRFF